VAEIPLEKFPKITPLLEPLRADAAGAAPAAAPEKTPEPPKPVEVSKPPESPFPKLDLPKVINPFKSPPPAVAFPAPEALKPAPAAEPAPAPGPAIEKPAQLIEKPAELIEKPAPVVEKPAQLAPVPAPAPEQLIPDLPIPIEQPPVAPDVPSPGLVPEPVWEKAAREAASGQTEPSISAPEQPLEAPAPVTAQWSVNKEEVAKATTRRGSNKIPMSGLPSAAGKGIKFVLGLLGITLIGGFAALYMRKPTPSEPPSEEAKTMPSPTPAAAKPSAAPGDMKEKAREFLQSYPLANGTPLGERLAQLSSGQPAKKARLSPWFVQQQTQSLYLVDYFTNQLDPETDSDVVYQFAVDLEAKKVEGKNAWAKDLLNVSPENGGLPAAASAGAAGGSLATLEAPKEEPPAKAPKKEKKEKKAAKAAKKGKTAAKGAVKGAEPPPLEQPAGSVSVPNDDAAVAPAGADGSKSDGTPLVPLPDSGLPGYGAADSPAGGSAAQPPSAGSDSEFMLPGVPSKKK
jgi:hypothetical protein